MTEEKEEKQIQYVSFAGRMLASVIDSVLSVPVLVPVFTLFNKLIGMTELRNKFADPEFVRQISQEQALEFLEKSTISISFQLFILTIVVMIFWIYKSATPGKMILKMRIVDAQTFEIPSKKQLIIRYLSYFISLIPFCMGFIWIYFDKKKQGWHDKIAKTVVIKT